MKIEERPCLSCGEPVRFFSLEPADVGQRVSYNDGEPRLVHEEEVGWIDAECSKCGMSTPAETIPLRLKGDVRAYLVDLDEVKLMNYLDILVSECMKAQNIVRGVLANL